MLELDDAGVVVEDVECASWDPRQYTNDLSGIRLFEEVGRRCSQIASDDRFGPVVGIAAGMPGTLLDSTTILTSSRLNVRERLNATKVLEDQTGAPARIYHDMACMAVGFDHKQPAGNETFAYVNLDEGVGSVLYVGGEPYKGAGVAGSLGRMVVEPDGLYFPEISARGTLEAYVGRPWISENCVALWEAEQGKRGGATANENTKFRRAVRAAAKNRRRDLTCAQIADGLAVDDPIAKNAASTAARYAGFGINCLLAIVHPHRVILGGSLCSELPGFAEDVELHTRMYSWPNAWNAIEFIHSKDSRRDERVGAARLFLKG